MQGRTGMVNTKRSGSGKGKGQEGMHVIPGVKEKVRRGVRSRHKAGRERSNARGRVQESARECKREKRGSPSPQELLRDRGAVFPAVLLRLLARELVDRVREVAAPYWFY